MLLAERFPLQIEVHRIFGSVKGFEFNRHLSALVSILEKRFCPLIRINSLLFQLCNLFISRLVVFFTRHGNLSTTKRTKRKGVEGLLITSLSNGQSIFLPAAGYFIDGRSREMGVGGYYWSRTRYQWSPSIAYFMTFQQPDVVTAEDLLNRCCGMTIRLSPFLVNL